MQIPPFIIKSNYTIWFIIGLRYNDCQERRKEIRRSIQYIEKIEIGVSL
ncbi:hypothetical protein MITSMUL_04111 [Mitsuokella multacida DSM 20544]|uniref:Uncharacterized protein n=1 Tax=Mitsuokella multacida DSM 20544 TaxID=500635 RepID=C9KLM6_9FIRM|nr:hypothetical protein MITSMUL_04111 [Mitsuokella multacida DSM 20544]